MSAKEVLVCSLQQSSIGGSNLQTLLRQIQIHPPAGRPGRVKVLIPTPGREVCSIVNRIFAPRNGRTSQLAADTCARLHQSEAANQRTILKVVDPEWGQSFVKGGERRQKAAANYSHVRGKNVVTLQIGKPHQVGMVVPILTATLGVKRFQQDGSRFNEQPLSDRGCDQRL